MGTVYAAHHELLDQRVAIKILFAKAARGQTGDGAISPRPEGRRAPEQRARRPRDGYRHARQRLLVHRDGWLEGADLAAILDRNGPMGGRMVADYVLQALMAIAQAHAQGIVHRDLKPSNLFLATMPDGSQIVEILDFGISKSTANAAKDGKKKVSALTGSGSVLGSPPPYMSPNKIRNPRTVDARTDIWSLGVSYELVTGQLPFQAEEVSELLAAILEKGIKPIRAHRADVPDELDKVIMRCLSRNRERRFANVGDLAHALAPSGTGTWSRSAERNRANPRARRRAVEPEKTRAACASRARELRRRDVGAVAHGEHARSQTIHLVPRLDAARGRRLGGRRRRHFWRAHLLHLDATSSRERQWARNSESRPRKLSRRRPFGPRLQFRWNPSRSRRPRRRQARSRRVRRRRRR